MKLQKYISKRILGFGALLFAAGLMVAPSLYAGGYSDYYSNKSSGSTSSNLTLKYGGTYGQAGQNYMNYRYGYGTGRNNDNYSSNYPGPNVQPRRQQITPEQKQEIDRLMKQSDALINQIQNDPRIWK